MAVIPVDLDTEKNRAYLIGKNDLAKENLFSLHSVFITLENIAGQEFDVLTVKLRSNDQIVVKVVLSGPKKPPIIG